MHNRDGRHHVRIAFGIYGDTHKLYVYDATTDIIVLLIIGVILVVLFLLWQNYLENLQSRSDGALKVWWTPPPLMKLSVWSRAKGRLAVMMFIGFLEWCSFMSWTFWVQVRLYSLSINWKTAIRISCLLRLNEALLPGIPLALTSSDNDPTLAYVCHWCDMQHYCRCVRRKDRRRLPHRFV